MQWSSDLPMGTALERGEGGETELDVLGVEIWWRKTRRRRGESESVQNLLFRAFRLHELAYRSLSIRFCFSAFQVTLKISDVVPLRSVFFASC